MLSENHQIDCAGQNLSEEDRPSEAENMAPAQNIQTCQGNKAVEKRSSSRKQKNITKSESNDGKKEVKGTKGMKVGSKRAPTQGLLTFGNLGATPSKETSEANESKKRVAKLILKERVKEDSVIEEVNENKVVEETSEVNGNKSQQDKYVEEEKVLTSDKQVDDLTTSDAKMAEEAHHDGQISLEVPNGSGKKRGRKPKDTSKTISSPQVPETKVIEIPQKIKEWKQRKEEFVAILRHLLNKGSEERENSKAPHNNGDVDQQKVSDEGFSELVAELTRNGQELSMSEQPAQIGLKASYSFISDLSKLALLKVLGPLIDASPLNLEKLTKICETFLESKLGETSQSVSKQFKGLLSKLHDLILTNAERKSYGIRQKESILYEDENPEALWQWELINTSLLPQSLQRNLVYNRGQLATLSQKIKHLDKLIQLIDKASSQEKDLPRIVEEYDKYNKVVRKENAAIQQNLLKEQQLREKERQEQEKLELKERERIAREQEKVAKEQERVRLLKEKEEAKERERIQKEEAKEKDRIAKEQEREADRLKKEFEKEQERLKKEDERLKKESERLEKKRIEDQERAARAAEAESLKKEKEALEKAQQAAQAAQLAKGQQGILNFLQKSQAPAIQIKVEVNHSQNCQDVVMHDNAKNVTAPLIQKPMPKPLSNPFFKSCGQTFDTLAKQTRSQLADQLGVLFSSHQVYLSKQPLLEDMRRLRAFDTFKPLPRKKCIIIDDSLIKYFGYFDKRSFFLNPRNPLRKDETVIDYDLDSEEEWNEQNGEDVAGDNKKDDEEDDEVEKLLREDGDDDEEAGFIVPDDYLSASELNLSQSQRSSQVQVEIEERRKQMGKRYNKGELNPNLHSYIFQLSHIMPQQVTSSPVSCGSKNGLVAYFEEFKAIAFPKDRSFPLRLKPQEQPEEEKLQGGVKIPSGINTKLVELVKIMHGSFESKQKIIDEFHQKYPDCSKKSIERKMRELFEKDKKESEPRFKWLATESTLIELNLIDDIELKSLFESRLNEVMDEVNRAKEEQQKLKDEQNKLKEEKRAQQIQEKMELKEKLQQEKKEAKERLKEEKVLLKQQVPNVTPTKSCVAKQPKSDEKPKQCVTNNEEAISAIIKVPEVSIPKKNENPGLENHQSQVKEVYSQRADSVKKPIVGLSTFFKKMEPEERSKHLRETLDKLQQDIKARQQIVVNSTTSKVAGTATISSNKVFNLKESSKIVNEPKSLINSLYPAAQKSASINTDAAMKNKLSVDHQPQQKASKKKEKDVNEKGAPKSRKPKAPSKISEKPSKNLKAQSEPSQGIPQTNQIGLKLELEEAKSHPQPNDIPNGPQGQLFQVLAKPVMNVINIQEAVAGSFIKQEHVEEDIEMSQE